MPSTESNSADNRSGDLAIDLVGRWFGVARDHASGYLAERLVELEIRSFGTRLAVVDHDRHRPVEFYDSPLEVTPGGLLTATLRGPLDLPIRLEGAVVAKDLEVVLTGTGINGRETLAVRLHRAPAAADRQLPWSRTDGRLGTPEVTDDGLAVAPPHTQGVSAECLRLLVEKLRSDRGSWNSSQTESVLVMRRGRIVFEEYFWGQAAGNPHQIASCAKSMVAIAAGVAVDRGLLDPESTVTSWFPDYGDCRWLREGYAITIRHLLTMTAGTEPIESRAADLVTSPDLARTVLDTTQVHDPGVRYAYDSGLPCLLALILARATGRSFESFISTEVFDQLGFSNYRWTQTVADGALACGAAYFRTRDLAKLGYLMQCEGQWGERRIISRFWATESTRHQTAPSDYPYGYYWHINDEAQTHVHGAKGSFALGAGGQVVGVFPAEELVVVITSASWHRDVNEYTVFELIDDFILVSLLDR